MKRILPVACSFLLLAAAAVAGPGPRPGRDGMHARHLERLSQELGLSEAQKASLQELHEGLAATVEPLREERRSLHEQVEAALERGADAATVGELVIASYKNRQAMRAAHEELKQQVAALLTPEQLAKFQALHEKWEERGGRRGHRGFGH